MSDLSPSRSNEPLTDAEILRIVATIDEFFKRVGTAWPLHIFKIVSVRERGKIKIKVRFRKHHDRRNEKDNWVNFQITFDPTISDGANAEHFYRALLVVGGTYQGRESLPPLII